ncbi:unnamed protein product, partial [Ectocarpus fasciculatus]
QLRAVRWSGLLHVWRGTRVGGRGLLRGYHPRARGDVRPVGNNDDTTPTAVIPYKPTSEPTSKPTPAPEARTTPSPVAEPTSNPTPAPEDRTTPSPVAEPTSKPT